jgi:hypothetical protein
MEGDSVVTILKQYDRNVVRLGLIRLAPLVTTLLFLGVLSALNRGCAD